jgi:hypothetical protein
MDGYWPCARVGEGFDRPQNLPVRQDQWRKMARLWQHSGVVAGTGAELWPWNWDQGNAIWVVGTGAVWAHGFYGEVTSDLWLSVPGNDGLVVARLRPDTQDIRLVWMPGAREWNAVQDPATPHGWWDVPLHVLEGDRWRDVRTRVSAEVIVGLEDIPHWVPRGRAGDKFFSDSPPGQQDTGTGGEAAWWFTDWVPNWTPGRTYRVTCSVRGITVVGGGGGTGWVELIATDYASGHELVRRPVVGPRGMGPTNYPLGGWTSFLLPNAQNTHLRLVCTPPQPYSPNWTPAGVIRFPPLSIRLEIYDAGGQPT